MRDESHGGKLAKDIELFVAQKRACGYPYVESATILRRFDRMVAGRHSRDEGGLRRVAVPRGGRAPQRARAEGVSCPPARQVRGGIRKAIVHNTLGHPGQAA
mgnify:CR=1 FL=1